MTARERARLAAIPDELKEDVATPEGVMAVMLSVARQSGSYRYMAADIITALLQHPEESNAAKLCALALVVGVLTNHGMLTNDGNGSATRDMLREVVPALAAALSMQD